MKLSPLGDKVIIKQLAAEETTKSGIRAKNLEILELINVKISGQEGDALTLEGVDSFVQE